MTYRNIAVANTHLYGPRFVGPNSEFELNETELADPQVKGLIKDGVLVPADDDDSRIDLAPILQELDSADVHDITEAVEHIQIEVPAKASIVEPTISAEKERDSDKPAASDKKPVPPKK